MKKKIWFYVIGLIALYFGLHMMMFCASGHLIDGAVNESNGDVSILTDLCYIETYSSNGTLLYKTKLEHNAGGFADLEYIDGTLYAKAYRTYAIFSVNSQGEISEPQDYTFVDEDFPWNEKWKKEGPDLVYQTGSHTYIYHKQNFWRVAFGKQLRTFEIIDQVTKESKTIWTELQDTEDSSQ